MRQAVNCKRDRRGNDVVDLNPRLVTEHAHEEEQRYILDDGNQHSRSDVIDAVGERHEEDDHGQKEIDDDQMAIWVRSPDFLSSAPTAILGPCSGALGSS